MVPSASTYRSGGSPASRATSAALAMAIVVALVLALIGLGALPRGLPGDGNPLTTFDVLSPGREQQASERPARRAERKQAPEKAATPPPPPAPPVEVTPEAPLFEGMIRMSRADFAATDIGRIRGTAAPRGAADGNADGEEATSLAAAGPGAGPGGERLYPADWFRKPTRAQTQPYMPANVREGWGMIACRTAPRYRVEDCRVLGESPGSGIARGLQEAAWQFKVLPPRVNGRPQIGTWVRIRFDIVEGVTR